MTLNIKSLEDVMVENRHRTGRERGEEGNGLGGRRTYSCGCFFIGSSRGHKLRNQLFLDTR